MAVAGTLAPGAAGAAGAAAQVAVSAEAGAVITEVGAAIAAGGEAEGLAVAMRIGGSPAGRALLNLAAEAAGIAAARIVTTVADQQVLRQINYILTRAFVLLSTGGVP